MNIVDRRFGITYFLLGVWTREITFASVFTARSDLCQVIGCRNQAHFDCA